MFDIAYHKTRHGKWVATLKYTVWDEDTPEQKQRIFGPWKSLFTLANSIAGWILLGEINGREYKTNKSD